MALTIVELILTIIEFSLLIYFVFKMDKDYREKDTHSMIHHAFWVFFLAM